VTDPGSGREIRIFADRAGLDHAAAELVAGLAVPAAAERGRFSLALSGGTTPQGLFALLASHPYRDRIDWQRTHIFWADERCVPPDHEGSNYGVGARLLLSKVPVPNTNIHRVRGEMDPASAASAYEREMGSFFGTDPFTFDLVILGMGADGHTASLFPGDPAVTEASRPAVPVAGSGARLPRVTLTLPSINRSRAVLFLVSGEGKARAVKEVLKGGEPGFPAARVLPVAGRLFWYLDSAAARMLGAAS
jgi:6-phosphogluconolactonase